MKPSGSCKVDSEAKPGRTSEVTPSLLGMIREKLRPVLLGKWRASRRRAADKAAEAGMKERERQLFLAGFQEGYWKGARDVSAISPSDLRPRRRSSGVH